VSFVFVAFFRVLPSPDEMFASFSHSMRPQNVEPAEPLHGLGKRRKSLSDLKVPSSSEHKQNVELSNELLAQVN